ncbi:MAG: efflux RND transporter periplasmic adaptor subunit [Spirochaetaceae bacterium]|jgi:HlyD family secretion protein|nr:efflux RND transporter periplasmic adaptor subunit [Spirochaetaceae bacterium]
MKSRKYLYVTVLILPLLFSSCGNSNENVSASGVFEATEIIVSSESTGTIVQLDLEEGEKLSKGQFLGEIDSVQLQLKKEQLLANIHSVENRRPDIKVQTAPIVQQLLTTEIEKKRIENLLNAGATNQKQLDDIKAQILVLEKQLEAQRTTLLSNNEGISREIMVLEIQVRQIEDQITRCTITSPLGGTVLAKYAEPGEFATTGKALVKIADTERIFLRAYISSSQLTELQLGQSIDVIADYGDKENRNYTGKITWISDKAEFTPKTIQTRDERSNLVYAVKIAVTNDGFLKIGMYGGIKQ